MVGKPQDNKGQAHRLAWNEGRGVWEIRWTERQNGKPRSRAVSTGVARREDKAQAEIFKAEWLEHETRLSLAEDEPRVSSLLDAYAAQARARGVTRTTFTHIENMRQAFGARRPSTLTPQDIVDYQAARGLKTSTVRRDFTALKAAIAYAVKQKVLDAALDPQLPTLPIGQGRLLYLDEDQEAEFHALAMGDSIGRKRLSRLTRFVALGLDTGARRGALLGLTWDRVDLSRGEIDFREPGMRLTKKRRAIVPISDRLRPTLERAWRERESARGLVVGDGHFEYTYREFFKSTPYAWVTPHVMRHTFATLMLRAGVDIGMVADLMGDDPRTVLKTYQHIAKPWRRDAVNARWK